MTASQPTSRPTYRPPSNPRKRRPHSFLVTVPADPSETDVPAVLKHRAKEARAEREHALASVRINRGTAPEGNLLVRLAGGDLAKGANALNALPAWHTGDPSHLYMRGKGWAARYTIEAPTVLTRSSLALPSAVAGALLVGPAPASVEARRGEDGEVRWQTESRYVAAPRDDSLAAYLAPWSTWQSETPEWCAILVVDEGVLTTMERTGGVCVGLSAYGTRRGVIRMASGHGRPSEVPVGLEGARGVLPGRSVKTSPLFQWALSATSKAGRVRVAVNGSGMLLVSTPQIEVLLPPPSPAASPAS